MRASRAYWLCQLIGWGLYVGITIAQITGAKISVQRALIETLLAAAIGIALTHGFRALVHRRGWLRLSASSLAPRVFAASLTLSVALVSCLSLIEFGVYDDHPPSRMLVFVAAVLRWSLVFFVWLALYFGFALLQERQRAEKALHAAELRALKSQLNPHFLFNSLNGIRALVTEDPKQAQAAVTQLARMLRYTLNAGQDELVTVENELQIVGDYLALEALRLGERLIVEREISADVNSVHIPAMLLQTLVENAVKHGISQLPDGGTLRICATMIDGALLIEVHNPRAASLVSTDRSSGIGLPNATHRLRLLFGERATLELDLSNAARAIARVTIKSAT